jgi:ABC-type branched-subunit amino acid transport system substrate-binding protein
MGTRLVAAELNRAKFEKHLLQRSNGLDTVIRRPGTVTHTTGVDHCFELTTTSRTALQYRSRSPMHRKRMAMKFCSSHRGQRTVAVLAVSALTLSAAACGGSDSGGGDGGGSTIKIMGIGLFESPALSLPDQSAAMKAKVESVNAAGGLGGKKIELILCDDKLDPNKASACARKAVQEKVVAVVAGYEPNTAQVLAVLEPAKVPFFNGYAINNRDANSPVEFPFTGGVITSYAAVGVALAEAGCTNMGVIAVTAEVVQVGADWSAKGMKANGGTSNKIDVSLDQASFDAELASLDKKGAECIVPATNPPQGASIAKTLNGRLPIGGIASEYPLQSLQTLGPLADQITIADQFYQPWDADRPEIKAITDAMAKYTPDTELTEAFGVLSWATMTGALDVIDAATEATPAAVLEAADKATDVKTDGLLGSFGWAEPGPIKSLPKFTNWSYLKWSVKDGKPVLSTPEFLQLKGVS